jgi:hypothetical protein
MEMNHSIKNRLFFLVSVSALILAGCGQTVQPNSGNSYEVEGSSTANASGTSSEDSTGEDDLNGSDNELNPNGPSDLMVSSIVSPNTVVLTWTDIDLKTDYDGYAVYRNINYTSWENIGHVEPEVGFFRDSTLEDPENHEDRGSSELKYLYRIAAYAETSTGDSAVSKWSNLAGTLPITSLGFESSVFDTPDGLNITRIGPTRYELDWGHSGRNPEMGFVIQRLAEEVEEITTTNQIGDSTYSFTRYVTRGNWIDLDTLGPTDNHIRISGVGPDVGHWVLDSSDADTISRNDDSTYRIIYRQDYINQEEIETYRVYAFYSDEFSGIISEFTPENVTGPEFDPTIQFATPGTPAGVLVSNTEVMWTWTNNHNVGDYVWGVVSGRRYNGETVRNPVAMILDSNNAFTTSFVYQDAENMQEACALKLTIYAEWRDEHGSAITAQSGYSDVPDRCPDGLADDASTGSSLAGPDLSIAYYDTTSGMIRLVWNDLVTSRLIEHYRLERSSIDGGFDSIAAIPEGVELYVDNDVDADSLRFYNYRLVAVSESAEHELYDVSQWSETVSLLNNSDLQPDDGTGSVVESLPLETPENLSITRIYPSVFLLNWEQSNAAEEDGFIIQRLSLDADIVAVTYNQNGEQINVYDGDWETIDTIPSDQNYFQVVEYGLSGSADSASRDRYRYRLAAYRGSETSEYTNEVVSSDEFREDIVFAEPATYIQPQVVLDSNGQGDCTGDINSCTNRFAWSDNLRNVEGPYTSSIHVEVERDINFGEHDTTFTISNNEHFSFNPHLSGLQARYDLTRNFPTLDFSAPPVTASSFQAFCTTVYRIRYRWEDSYGGVAYTPWTEPFGVRVDTDVPSNISNFCGFEGILVE